ncbi:MAG: DUF1329 domain-containing protein [Candidatus Dadabacteria bacterium]|nr:MAG: DUF1329 domain-containing protein [Candidatus Dadabacteria bacterium]
MQLGPVIEPFDMPRLQYFWSLDRDPERKRDAWYYNPQFNRLFRMQGDLHWLSYLNQEDIDMDSFGGYAGRVEWANWKYLGQRTVLAPFELSEWTDWLWRKDSEAFFPKVLWEPRRVAVVEGRSVSHHRLYSRRVIYLDLETYRVVYSELYDQKGELWKLLFNTYYFSSDPFPADSCKDDWEFPYLAAETVVDTQRRGATWCAMGFVPVVSGSDPWSVNKGEGAWTSGSSDALFSIEAGR